MVSTSVYHARTGMRRRRCGGALGEDLSAAGCRAALYAAAVDAHGQALCDEFRAPYQQWYPV